MIPGYIAVKGGHQQLADMKGSSKRCCPNGISVSRGAGRPCVFHRDFIAQAIWHLKSLYTTHLGQCSSAVVLDRSFFCKVFRVIPVDLKVCTLGYLLCILELLLQQRPKPSQGIL